MDKDATHAQIGLGQAQKLDILRAEVGFKGDLDAIGFSGDHGGRLAVNPELIVTGFDILDLKSAERTGAAHGEAVGPGVSGGLIQATTANQHVIARPAEQDVVALIVADIGIVIRDQVVVTIATADVVAATVPLGEVIAIAKADLFVQYGPDDRVVAAAQKSVFGDEVLEFGLGKWGDRIRIGLSGPLVRSDVSMVPSSF